MFISFDHQGIAVGTLPDLSFPRVHEVPALISRFVPVSTLLCLVFVVGVLSQVTRRAAKITFVSFLLHRFDATMRRPPVRIAEPVMPTLRSWPMVQFAICNFFALHALLFLCLQNVPLLARAFLSQRISIRPPNDSPAMLACANPPRLDAFEGVEEKHAKGCLYRQQSRT